MRTLRLLDSICEKTRSRACVRRAHADLAPKRRSVNKLISMRACVQPDKLLHPFIYPEICPMSACDSPYIPFLSCPTVPSSSIAACCHKSQRAWKDREAFKEKKKTKQGKQKMVKEGKTLAGVSFSFRNKRPVGIHLGPICWHRATGRAASWLDQHGWKKW